MDQSLLVRDCSMWTEAGLRQGSILVEDGRITKVARRIPPNTATLRINAKGLLALPGLVDAHAHLRGLKLSHKEDFATGTSAAAAGGFTTVLDMPNTVPPTDSPARLTAKMEEASRGIVVNVGFHAAVVSGRTVIERLSRMGAFSLKLYMPRPISQLDVSNDETLRKTMGDAFNARIPMTVHAEEPAELESTAPAQTIVDMARARPEIAEIRAVSRILRINKSVRSPIHFCHISLTRSLRAIQSSRTATSEVTPHHILLSSRLLNTAGWSAWMVPPLRGEAERRKLLSAVARGRADVIATDHAPHLVREKKLSPRQSPPGIPGLETALPLLMTLFNRGVITIGLIVKSMARNPARIFGLTSKGKISRGYDGDIVLVDPKEESVIRPERFQSKAKYSPFEGWRTRGQVHTTIVGGQVVYQSGRVLAKPGDGRVLKRRR